MLLTVVICVDIDFCMFYDANIGERCETIRTWFERGVNKKALLSSRTTEPGKSKICNLSLTLKPLYVVCVVSLQIVFAQGVARAQLVADYFLYHHVLITELLDDDFIIRWVGMHAADIVVGNPNRIVAVLGINHKKPRSALVLIHCLVKDFLDGFVNKCLFTVENFLNERLLVLCVELIYPCCKDGEQEDD